MFSRGCLRDDKLRKGVGGVGGVIFFFTYFISNSFCIFYEDVIIMTLKYNLLI